MSLRRRMFMKIEESITTIKWVVGNYWRNGSMQTHNSFTGTDTYYPIKNGIHVKSLIANFWYFSLFDENKNFIEEQRIDRYVEVDITTGTYFVACYNNTSAEPENAIEITWL